MTNLERVDHDCADHAKWVLVDWTLGTTCNFRCSYCPSSLHDGKRKFPASSDVVKFASFLAGHYEALGRSVFIQFTGGEVSLYSQLPLVVRMLKERGICCGLLSNGSGGLAFWSQVCGSLDSVVLTHHIEFANFDHFRAVTEMLSNAIRTHAQVTMLPDRFQECLDRAYALRAGCPRACVGLKPLRVNFGSRLYGYTSEQLAVLRDPPIPPPRNPILGGVRGLMRLKAGGASQTLSAPRILAGGLNRWEGWTCAAGLELLAINAEGDVYRGLCREGGCLGNVRAGVRLPTAAVVCGRPDCSCLTDIMTTKSRSGPL